MRKRKYDAKVSKFIDAFWKKEFRSPVIPEIMEACGISSKSMARYVLRKIVQVRGDKFRKEKYARTAIIPQWVIAAIKSTSDKAGHGQVIPARPRKQASKRERLDPPAPILIEDIAEPCILFFIHHTYSPTLSEQEVYDCTRQFWQGVAKRKREALVPQTALAMVKGVVMRVYRIEGWYLAGSTFSSRACNGTRKDKWEFVGQLLKDHPLVGRKLVESNGETIKATQKGYRYLPRA